LVAKTSLLTTALRCCQETFREALPAAELEALTGALAENFPKRFPTLDSRLANLFPGAAPQLHATFRERAMSHLASAAPQDLGSIWRALGDAICDTKAASPALRPVVATLNKLLEQRRHQEAIDLVAKHEKDLLPGLENRFYSLNHNVHDTGDVRQKFFATALATMSRFEGTTWDRLRPRLLTIARFVQKQMNDQAEAHNLRYQPTGSTWQQQPPLQSEDSGLHILIADILSLSADLFDADTAGRVAMAIDLVNDGLTMQEAARAQGWPLPEMQRAFTRLRERLRLPRSQRSDDARDNPSGQVAAP
jgi:hypothetical protein